MSEEKKIWNPEIKTTIGHRDIVILEKALEKYIKSLKKPIESERMLGLGNAFGELYEYSEKLRNKLKSALE